MAVAQQLTLTRMCMIFKSDTSSGGGEDEVDLPPVLHKGTVKQIEIYQVGLPFLGLEPGMVSGKRCLSAACKGKFCWHKTRKQQELKETPEGFEGEIWTDHSNFELDHR